MKAKLSSRKFLLTVAGVITVIGNDYFNLHLSNDAVYSIVTMIASYVIGQGYVDGQKVSK